MPLALYMCLCVRYESREEEKRPKRLEHNRSLLGIMLKRPLMLSTFPKDALNLPLQRQERP